MNDDQLLNNYGSYLFDGQKGLGELNDVWSVCEPLINDLLDDFYGNIRQQDELIKILGGSARSIEKLKNAQLSHWAMVLGGKLGVDFQTSSKTIGAVHERIGLSQGWYLASYAWVLMRLLPKLSGKSRFGFGGKSKGVIEQVVARVFLDMIMSTAAYEDKVIDTMLNHSDHANNTNNLRSLADTVVQVNATSFHLARLVGNAREVRLGSQTISSAASQLVASVEQIAVNSESAADEANESNQTAQNGHNAIAEATTAIGKMLDAVNETNEGIEELSEASNQIGQILSDIEDIANQTNLLALNATIEAARAGEAGKGFAVVASEVKTLAAQTSKSTEDIARRIEALSSGMDKIRRTMSHSQSAVGEGETAVASAAQTMDQISGQVSGVYEKMNDISNILQQQKGAANEIAHSITNVADLSVQNEDLIGLMSTSFQTTNDQFSSNARNWFQEGSDQALCEMAKIDHVLFKKRVIDTIMERDNWSTSEIPDHHSCRLGKWYDALQKPDIIGLSAYKALVGPHKIVHDAGKQALSLHAAGDFNGAIAEVERMNDASVEVVRLLTEISASQDAESISDLREYERLQTSMNAKLDCGDCSDMDIVIEDISQEGVGIKGIALERGKSVSISIGNDGPREGITKWTAGDRAGVQFEAKSVLPVQKKAG